jgi:hypothetical protein
VCRCMTEKNPLSQTATFLPAVTPTMSEAAGMISEVPQFSISRRQGAGRTPIGLGLGRGDEFSTLLHGETASEKTMFYEL